MHALSPSFPFSRPLWVQLGVANKSSKLIDGAIISEIFEQPEKITSVKAAGESAAVVSRVLGFTSEGREKADKKAAKKAEEERKKFSLATPKIILQANVKRWTQMSDRIETQAAKDVLGKDGAILGNQMYTKQNAPKEEKKKKKKKKKVGEDEAAEEEAPVAEEPAPEPAKKEKKKKSISKSLIKQEDEEVLGFGELAVSGYDEETFGFAVEGADDATAALLESADRQIDVGLDIVKGTFVVAAVAETHTQEQARLKREAEQKEKASIAAAQLVETLRIEAAANAILVAKEKKAAEEAAAAERMKVALAKDAKFFKKKMEDATSRRQAMIDAKKAQFAEAEAAASKIDMSTALSHEVQRKMEAEEHITSRLATTQKADHESNWAEADVPAHDVADFTRVKRLAQAEAAAPEEREEEEPAEAPTGKKAKAKKAAEEAGVADRMKVALAKPALVDHGGAGPIQEQAMSEFKNKADADFQKAEHQLPTAHAEVETKIGTRRGSLKEKNAFLN
jgi:hypothetical protein